MSIKIGVVGATGRVGSAIVTEALNRGYYVVGVNRSGTTGGIKSNHMENLQIIGCDATNKDDLIKAFDGCQVVVHAAAPPKGVDTQGAIDFQQKVSTAVIESAIAVHAERVLAIGGAGTLLTNGKRNMDYPGIPPFLEFAMKSAERVYNVVTAEKRIPATVLCPSNDLVDGERTGKYRTGGDDTVYDANGVSKITVDDLACALVDEIEQKKHMSGRLTAGY